MLDALKSRTSSRHQRAEKSLVGHLRSLKNEGDYAALLVRMYRFHAAVENGIVACLGSLSLQGFRGERRTGDLLDDLSALGVEPAATGQEVLVFNCPGEAYGAWYVLEGSRLGGQHIERMVRQRFGARTEQLRFFHGKGEGTGVLWQEFREALLLAGPDLEDLARGALLTFDYLHALLETHDEKKL